MSNVEYFEASIRDVEAIGKFNKITDPELYKHEYWTRLMGHSVLMAARDKEKIIGLQAMIAYYMNVNDRKMLTGKSERTLVSPEYRGQDIWARLMENCIEEGTNRGHKFFWGASTDAIKAFKKVGYLHIQGHRQYLLSSVSLYRVVKLITSSESPISLNPITIYRTVRSRNLTQNLQYVRFLASIYASLFKFINIKIHKESASDQFQIENRPLGDNDIANLYQEIRGEKGNLVWLHQDEEFCDWAFRLGQNNVKRWFAYKNGKLRAYLYGWFIDSVAHVLDFAAADAEAFNYLLVCFRKSCIEEGQTFIQAIVNPLCTQQRISIKCLKKNGFLPVFTGGNSVVRIGQYKDLNILGDPGSYYMTTLWSMLYKSRSV